MNASILLGCADFYRKALWQNMDCYVEVWSEKDALTGVVYPITSVYDVPLMVARGYASLSFLYGAADYIKRLSVPTYIYYLGDYDPSGVDASRFIDETLRELAPEAEIHFERVAVTPAQIIEWDLPSRPNKKGDKRTSAFEGVASVELDAIEPNELRAIVLECIERHMPEATLEVLKAAEESERDILQEFIGQAFNPDEYSGHVT